MDDQIEERAQVDLALIRQQYQSEYSVRIDYIKSQVGSGTEYLNSIARAVVSGTGAYYELLDLPEEFGGAASPMVDRHFLSRVEALDLITRAVASVALVTAENTRILSIFALYTRRGLVDRKGCYVYEFRRDAEGDVVPPLEIGQFRTTETPLFFKVRIDSDFCEDQVHLPPGLSFCMANAGDRHLLVTIPAAGAEVTDLNRPAGRSTVQ